MLARVTGGKQAGQEQQEQPLSNIECLPRTILHHGFNDSPCFGLGAKKNSSEQVGAAQAFDGCASATQKTESLNAINGSITFVSPGQAGSTCADALEVGLVADIVGAFRIGGTEAESHRVALIDVAFIRGAFVVVSAATAWRG